MARVTRTTVTSAIQAIKAIRPRLVEIKKKSDGMGYSCRNLRVEAEAGEGPVFMFWNNTELTVVVDFVRHRLVFNRKGDPVRTINLRPGQASGPLRVNTTLRPGTYEYQVFMREARIEAEGGSRPGIEIVP